jgi:hypothetical protein
MIEYRVEQNTEEWYELRKGIPTASSASKLVSNGGKLSEQITDYGHKMAAEIAGARIEGYTSASMQRGHDLEPEARAQYAFEKATVDHSVGIIKNDEQTFGYSPDGLVGDDGLIEIKCLEIKGYMKALIGKKTPTDYIAQCQSALWITGRKWIDLVIYMPGLKLLTFRILPDKAFHAMLASQVAKVISIRNDALVNHLGVEIPSTTKPTETPIEF